MGSQGNRRGPPGPEGIQGPAGPQGPQGEAGTHAPFAIFPAVVLDNAGEATVQAPANVARAFALAQGTQAYVVRVLDVDGSNVTVQVRRATTPALSHSSTSAGTPAGIVDAPTIELISGMVGDPAVRHNGIALSNGGGGLQTLTGVQAPLFHGNAMAGHAHDAHPATALPLAQGDTVDLLVFWEAA
jgi:hypothetical protein